MTAPFRVRGRDISGIPFPAGGDVGSSGLPATVQVRPPQFEPPDSATEFNLSFSIAAPGNAKTALFTLDVNNNPIVPSAALQLPQGAIARINNVEISGDTGAAPGAPQLIFSISSDRTGQQSLPGWDGIGLPGRGGVVSVGFEPFTRIFSPGSFFGGFVQNLTAGPLYAEMIITGWYWVA